VIPYDKWSHLRIRGLLTYMRYTNRSILYFTLERKFDLSLSLSEITLLFGLSLYLD